MAYEKFEKVLRNVDKLSSQNVSARELNQYLRSEGYTQERFDSAAKNYANAKGLKSEYGLIRAGLQGLTFGFSDEAEAAVKSLLNKKPYEQNLAAIQFSKQQFEYEEPVKAAAAEVAGSIPTAFLAGASAVRAAQAMPSVTRALQALPTSAKGIAAVTGAGAAFGGVTGAGTAEPGQRLEGAKTGAQTGAILAPVTLGLMKAGGGAVKTVSEKLGIPEGAAKVVEATKDIPIVKAITGKTAEYLNLGKDAIQRRADTKLIQALQRDGLTIPEIKTSMDTIRASGYKPETILEFGGKATKQLGETVASYPGARAAAETLVEERKAGAANRILTDFQQAFKVDADPLEIANNVIKLRQSTSAPLYKAAYEKDALIGGDAIDKLMQDPAFKRAYERANRLAQREVDDAGNIIGTPLPELKETGNVFDLRNIDRIKRGIDAEINFSKLPSSDLEKTEIDSIKNLRNVFMNTVDKQAPVEYKQARQAFAGQSEILDAIESGKNFFDIDARQLKQIYNKLTPSEKDGFSVGAYDAIRMKIREGADGIDVVRRTFGSAEKRDQIKELIGSDAFETLSKQLAREKDIRSTDIRILGGSQTQPRQVAQQEFEGATELVPTMAEKGIGKGAMDYLLRSVSGVGGRTAEQLAPDIYSVNPQAQAQMLERLSLLDDYLRQQALKSQVGAGVVTPSLLD
jgi:hypothetical protein